MLILGIESSCDDAAAAVLESDRPGVAIVRASRTPTPLRTFSEWVNPEPGALQADKATWSDAGIRR